MAVAAVTVHVVTHTHWDREWYQPASRFRQRLVRLVTVCSPFVQPDTCGAKFFQGAFPMGDHDQSCTVSELLESRRSLFLERRVTARRNFVRDVHIELKGQGQRKLQPRLHAG